MINKLHLQIDLIGQVVLILGFLIGSIANIEATLVWWLYLLFLIGCWQLFNGIVTAIAYRDTTRIKYVVFAGIYLILLVTGAYILKTIPFVGSTFKNIIGGVYFFGGTFLFATWYFRQTLLDLKSQVSISPKTFWDLRF